MNSIDLSAFIRMDDDELRITRGAGDALEITGRVTGQELRLCQQLRKASFPDETLSIDSDIDFASHGAIEKLADRLVIHGNGHAVIIADRQFGSLHVFDCDLRLRAIAPAQSVHATDSKVSGKFHQLYLFGAAALIDGGEVEELLLESVTGPVDVSGQWVVTSVCAKGAITLRLGPGANLTVANLPDGSSVHARPDATIAVGAIERYFPTTRLSFVGGDVRIRGGNHREVSFQNLTSLFVESGAVQTREISAPGLMVGGLIEGEPHDLLNLPVVWNAAGAELDHINALTLSTQNAVQLLHASRVGLGLPKRARSLLEDKLEECQGSQRDLRREVARREQLLRLCDAHPQAAHVHSVLREAERDARRHSLPWGRERLLLELSRRLVGYGERILWPLIAGGLISVCLAIGFVGWGRFMSKAWWLPFHLTRRIGLMLSFVLPGVSALGGNTVPGTWGVLAKVNSVIFFGAAFNAARKLLRNP